MKKIIIDLDGTLTRANTTDYKSVLPKEGVIERLSDYKAKGFYIVINTARNMRTHDSEYERFRKQPFISDSKHL